MNNSDNHSKVKRDILDAIRNHETIIISRHSRPDGDAVGSTTGLARILRLSYPDKRVFLDNEDFSEYVAFLGDREEPRPSDSDYNGALVIVIDTGTVDRISNRRYDRGAMLVKIDHHIDNSPYGDLSWVEEERSSACEMIVDLQLTFRDELCMDAEAATCLYAGMVTDSGRFRYQGTTGETLRCAAALLDRNIDAETLFAHLYLDDIRVLQYHAAMTQRIRVTENGVAYLHVSRALRRRRGLSMEEASNIASLMDGIRGCLIWLTFIENDDGSIRVRLRSRFVHVQPLATRYHGGGHACASGATVYSREEEQALLADADELLKRYKEEHTGWL